MDFTYDDDQESARSLAEEIFAKRVTHERLKEVESGECRVDTRLWNDLLETGLLGVALPEERGGAGLGYHAMCLLLSEAGRKVAPVPILEALAAAMFVAESGDAEQKLDVVDGLATDGRRTTLALEEFVPGSSDKPLTTATEYSGGWRINGVKATVPSPVGAERLLVSATVPDGTGVFLVRSDADGLRWESAETTNLDLSGNLTLTDTSAQRIGDSASLRRLLDIYTMGIVATQVGVARGAVEMSIPYLAERTAFGRPIGSMEAVQHKMADCYIAIEAMTVTQLEAACAFADGRETRVLVAVAKWWASTGGTTVMHNTQHVHGGIGVDVDYPLHRYFLHARQLAGALGGPTSSLVRLGDLLATIDVRS